MGERQPQRLGRDVGIARAVVLHVGGILRIDIDSWTTVDDVVAVAVLNTN